MCHRVFTTVFPQSGTALDTEANCCPPDFRHLWRLCCRWASNKDREDARWRESRLPVASVFHQLSRHWPGWQHVQSMPATQDILWLLLGKIVCPPAGGKQTLPLTAWTRYRSTFTCSCSPHRRTRSPWGEMSFHDCRTLEERFVGSIERDSSQLWREAAG